MFFFPHIHSYGALIEHVQSHISSKLMDHFERKLSDSVEKHRNSIPEEYHEDNFKEDPDCEAPLIKEGKT
eukprot:602545-Amorphochlora_amoeboformis.AAC.1